MCHGRSNYRTPSLIVGWLSVVSSILAVIFFTFLLVGTKQKMDKYAESEDKDIRQLFDHKEKQFYTTIAYIAVAVLLYFVPSILLLKGIKQNRRLLLAPWLYISYASVAINCIFLGFWFCVMSGFSRSLATGFIICLPWSLALILFCLCIYPVCKLYKIMSIPTPILPTQYVMTTKKPEDHQGYMPILKS